MVLSTPFSLLLTEIFKGEHFPFLVAQEVKFTFSKSDITKLGRGQKQQTLKPKPSPHNAKTPALSIQG